MSEIWRRIPGYSTYEASDLGGVRSWRSRNGRGVAKTPHQLAPIRISGSEYYRVTIVDDDGALKIRRVHQLILETFVGSKPPGMEPLHGDGDGSNNTLSNLRWGTPQENADDRIAHGTQLRGEQIDKAILTDEQVATIKETIAAGKWKHGTGRKFALEFGVSDGAISSIKRNRTWNHV